MSASQEDNPSELQDPKVGELLDEFLLAEESGTPFTPEELCGDDLELLAALRRAIDRQRRFEALKDDSDQLPLVYGAYDVVETLGKGGCGTVFRAKHRHLQRDAAVKVVVLSENNPLAEAHFIREIEVVREFEHDRVATIFDSGVLNHGTTTIGWLAMEYMPGGQIDKYVSNTGRTERDVLSLIRSVVSTLRDAHQSGILHHDIKPGNILMSEHGEPHLTDFGLARIAGSNPSTNLVGPVGTPGYIAPELKDGNHRPGVTSEIYSLGVVLGKLLCQSASRESTVDQKPTADESPTVVDSQTVDTSEHSSLKRKQYRVLAGRRSRDLNAVLDRMTALVPEQRYSSFAQLLAEIDRLLDGDLVAARPVSLAEKGIRWIHRNPSRALLWSFFGATLITILGLVVANVAARYDHAQEVDKKNHALLAREEQLHRATVSSRLRSIQPLLNHNRIVVQKQLEDETLFPPTFRSFAWNYLRAEAAVETFDLSNVGEGFESIHQIKFSPDNRQLAVCSKPRCLSLIDISNGTRQIVSHEAWLVASVLARPNLTTFFCQESNGNLLEVSWESGEVIRRIPLPAPVRARTALNSQGDRVYGLTKQGQPFRMDLASEETKLGKDHIEGIPAGLWLTPDDQVLHCVTRQGLWQRWNAATLEEVQQQNLFDFLPPEFFQFSSSDVTLRAVEACYETSFGLCIALGFNNRITTVVWPESKRSYSVMARSSILTNHFAFRPSFQCVVPDGKGGLLFSVFDSRDQQAIGPVTDSVIAAAVSTDQTWIATGGSKGKLFVRRFLNASERAMQMHTFRGEDLGFGPPVRTIPLGSSGETLVCHREGWCAVINTDTGQMLEGFQMNESQFSTSARASKSELVALGFREPNSRIVALQVEGGRLCQGQPSSPRQSSPETPLFLPPKPLFEIDCDANVTAVSFTKNENDLVVALRNGDLFTVDVASGRIVRRWNKFNASSACLSMSAIGEDMLCGCADGWIHRLDINNGTIRNSWKAGNSRVYSLATIRDASRIVSGMASGAMRVFDTQGTLLGQMSGHQGRVVSLAVSSDGQTLASGSADHKIAIWDTLSGEMQLLLEHHTDSVTDLCFHGDASELWSTSADGAIYRWTVHNAASKGHARLLQDADHPQPDG